MRFKINKGDELNTCSYQAVLPYRLDSAIGTVFWDSLCGVWNKRAKELTANWLYCLSRNIVHEKASYNTDFSVHAMQI